MVELLNCKFLRLVWHPSHFEGGKLKASAFSRSDLDGESYLSVDDEHVISKPSVDWRIGYQQRDGRAEKNDRKLAKFALFKRTELEACTEQFGGQPHQLFSVTDERTHAGEDGPESPENPAHRGIRNARLENYRAMARKDQRRYTDMLRVKLLRIEAGIFSYEDIFGVAA